MPVAASTMQGLIQRAKSTPSVAALVGGRIFPGIPPGATALPHVVFTQTAAPTSEFTSGPRMLRITQEAFQVTITTGGEAPLDAAEAIRSALDSLFTPYLVSRDQIPLADGSIFAAWLDGWHFNEGVEPDKGGTLVRRLMADLFARTSRVKTLA